MTTTPIVEEVWKACDLRGVYPGSITPALFRSVGGAIGTILVPGARVLVAGDNRLSTPGLMQALSEGLAAAGAGVRNAGHIPTPLAYFAARHTRADAVLMVTASHNPPQYNGLKLMLNSVPTTPEELGRIRALSEAGCFRQAQGNVERVDLRAEYLKTMLKRWRHLRGGGAQRVVLDAGNGIWSELAPVLFTDLGFDARCISCVSDGSFPDRPPDCARASNLVRLSQAVREHRNAIGVAWDGDGDRVAFVDEDGLYVTPDEIALLLVRSALTGDPIARDPIARDAGAGPHRSAEAGNGEARNGETGDGEIGTAKIGGATRRVVIDVKCSDLVRGEVVRCGGEPVIARTGHAFMRGRMVDERARLGLDACGHYFFAELDGGDDGVFAALSVLEAVESSGKTLRALRRELPRIFSAPEFRIPAALLPFAELRGRLRAAFPDAETSQVDGLRLLMADGVVLARESGTEPVLSLRIEGFTQESFEGIVERCAAFLPTLGQLLRVGLEEAPHPI